jgi:hypothetical protein
LQQPIEGLSIDRLERNEKLVTQYLYDSEFQEGLFKVMARRISDAVQGIGDDAEMIRTEWYYGMISREQGVVNRPLVYVSWHDALGYCVATVDLQEWSDPPELLATMLRTEDWQVILPSEAEWEKAACSMERRFYP